MIRILSENGIDTTTEVDFESMPTHVQRILQGISTNYLFFIIITPCPDPLFYPLFLPLTLIHSDLFLATFLQTFGSCCIISPLALFPL